MDADSVVTLINDELLRCGVTPIVLSEVQRQQAFASLKAYVAHTGRPLEVAVQDVVRFQLQTMSLQA